MNRFLLITGIAGECLSEEAIGVPADLANDRGINLDEFGGFPDVKGGAAVLHRFGEAHFGPASVSQFAPGEVSPVIHGIITAIEWFMKNTRNRRETSAFPSSSDAVVWLSEQSGVEGSELTASFNAARPQRAA